MGCKCKEQEARIRDLEIEKQETQRRVSHAEMVTNSFHEMNIRYVQAVSEVQELRIYIAKAQANQRVMLEKLMTRIENGRKSIADYLIERGSTEDEIKQVLSLLPSVERVG